MQKTAGIRVATFEHDLAQRERLGDPTVPKPRVDRFSPMGPHADSDRRPRIRNSATDRRASGRRDLDLVASTDVIETGGDGLAPYPRVAPHEAICGILSVQDDFRD
jgi:hypothetical protein